MNCAGDRVSTRFSTAPSARSISRPKVPPVTYPAKHPSTPPRPPVPPIARSAQKPTAVASTTTNRRTPSTNISSLANLGGPSLLVSADRRDALLGRDSGSERRVPMRT